MIARPIRVAVVDDHELIRDSFAEYLDSFDDITVLARAADGAALLERAAEGDLDVVVMDVRMPVMSGVEATRHLQEMASPPRVIILTTFNDDTYVRLAIAHGARGFLLKDSAPADLVDAVRQVADGGVVLSDDATEHVFRAIRPQEARAAGTADPRRAVLSPREAEILDLIGAGMSNPEIAEHLVVAESTVKTHVRALLTKLDCRDRVALVRIALMA